MGLSLRIWDASATGRENPLKNIGQGTMFEYQEEGEYEYVSDHNSAKPGQEEVHLESGVIY